MLGVLQSSYNPEALPKTSKQILECNLNYYLKTIIGPCNNNNKKNLHFTRTANSTKSVLVSLLHDKTDK